MTVSSTAQDLAEMTASTSNGSSPEYNTYLAHYLRSEEVVVVMGDAVAQRDEGNHQEKLDTQEKQASLAEVSIQEENVVDKESSEIDHVPARDKATKTSTPPPAIEQQNKGEHEPPKQASLVQEAESATLFSGESGATPPPANDGPMLATSWPLEKKAAHICASLLFFLILPFLWTAHEEELGQGNFWTDLDIQQGNSTLLSRASHMSMGFGLALGSLFATFLPAHNWHCLAPVLVMAIGSTCTVVGFTKSSGVISTLRGVLGCASGIIIVLLTGIAMNLSVTRRLRLTCLTAYACSLLFSCAMSRWIVHRLHELGRAPWAYWLTALFCACHVIVMGIMLRESNNEAIINNYKRLRDARGQRSIGTCRVTFSDLYVRFSTPFVVIARHKQVVLVGVLIASVSATNVAFFVQLPVVLRDLHGTSLYTSAAIYSAAEAVAAVVVIVVLFISTLVDKRQAKQSHLQSRPACHTLCFSVILCLSSQFLLGFMAAISQVHWAFVALGSVLTTTTWVSSVIEAIDYLCSLLQTASACLGKGACKSSEHALAIQHSAEAHVATVAIALCLLTGTLASSVAVVVQDPERGLSFPILVIVLLATDIAVCSACLLCLALVQERSSSDTVSAEGAQ